MERQIQRSQGFPSLQVIHISRARIGLANVNRHCCSNRPLQASSEAWIANLADAIPRAPLSPLVTI